MPTPNLMALAGSDAEMALSYVSVAAVHPNAFPLLVGRPPVLAQSNVFSTVVAILDGTTDDLPCRRPRL